MDKKRLKIYKGVALVTGGITFANVISYNIFANGFNLKPFTDNDVEFHKVTIEEYTTDGINKESYYSSKKQSDYLVIKQPFIADSDSYSRITYNVPTRNYSIEDVNFIINNINNVDILLEQEYIENILGRLNFIDYEANYETVSVLPDDNNYEFGYVKYNIDENDYKIFSSKEFDLLVTMYYLLLTGIISITEFILYLTIKKVVKEDKEIKALEKTNKMKKV